MEMGGKKVVALKKAGLGEESQSITFVSLQPPYVFRLLPQPQILGTSYVT